MIGIEHTSDAEGRLDWAFRRNFAFAGPFENECKNLKSGRNRTLNRPKDHKITRSQDPDAKREDPKKGTWEVRIFESGSGNRGIEGNDG